MEQAHFNGGYNAGNWNSKQTIEAFYQQQTSQLPNFYQIACQNIEQAMLHFKTQFGSLIQDYIILDCSKMMNGWMNYKLCYVLKNDIFVIIDEVQQHIKVLYHTIKTDDVKRIVLFFQHHP